MDAQQIDRFVKKINTLSPAQVRQAELFIDFLSQQEDRRLVEGAMTLSQPSLNAVWDNDEDSVYDDL
ncbi:MAG TPA: toxin-antitoxin system, antitoxin component, Xre family protein [Rhodospirillaceae bacterium]|nr:toxin-antitoxin system, antitoxin component, Xre family protein [Alphaproteobacteria bacterium]HBH26142.1 toxin-antitoxin system, antitoxin component, Xre family protein [Rhodospirillaceae bacterium]